MQDECWSVGVWESKKQSAEWKNILFNALLSAINSP